MEPAGANPHPCPFPDVGLTSGNQGNSEPAQRNHATEIARTSLGLTEEKSEAGATLTSYATAIENFLAKSGLGNLRVELEKVDAGVVPRRQTLGGQECGPRDPPGDGYTIHDAMPRPAEWWRTDASLRRHEKIGISPTHRAT